MRGLVDRRAAGIGQAEHPGHLVVGLAGRVVDGRADLGDLPGQIVHLQQLGVPAGNQQGQARRGQRAVLQGVRRDVTGQVVDPVERHVQRGGIGLGRLSRTIPFGREQRWAPGQL